MAANTDDEAEPDDGGDEFADGGAAVRGESADREPATYPHSRVYRWLDTRVGLTDSFLGKAFPEDSYSSFLLGEVALFTFVILALTGTFLGLLYNPGAAEITYQGSVVQYQGQTVPGAFASVLRITYDVRFGMFVRYVHHWAAYLFLAAIALHMLRVFITGAYRNPREVNWVVGTGLLLLALVEGFLGYALPYDNFSATATTIGFQLTGAIPVFGTLLKNLIFGGNFPADASTVLPRMEFLHVFLLPATIAVLLSLHLVVLVRQGHTEQPSQSRGELDSPHAPEDDDDDTVVGMPLVPNQAFVSGVVFLFTLGVLSLLAAFFPVQDLTATGPADPTTTPSGVAPDWYFTWVFGMLKLMPSALDPYTEFIGGVVLPTITIAVLALWPFIDSSDEQVQFVADPLDRPKQTAVGVAGVVFIIMLSLAGMNSTIAQLLGTSTGAIQPWLQVLVPGIPVLDALIVYYVLSRREPEDEAGAIEPGDRVANADGGTGPVAERDPEVGGDRDADAEGSE